MKKVLIASLLISLTTPVDALPFRNEDCTNYSYSTSQLFKNTINSVVVVKTTYFNKNDELKKSQGSGFVVKQDDKNTYILTNAHVVRHKKWVDIKWSDDEESTGTVIGNLGGYELSKDLALIKVPERKGKPLKLLDKNPDIGIDAVVIGSPSGLEFSLTRGVVSQVREKGNFVQIDAPVNPGNSGGPVFNSAGCVIGVVSFKLGKSSQGLNFAIGSKLISKFVENPFIDKEAVNKKIQSDFPPPPLPLKGPFPPFTKDPFYQSEAIMKITGSPQHIRSVEYENEWDTLTLTTKITKSDKERGGISSITGRPISPLRYMIRKKTIKLVNDWYFVDVIRGNPLERFHMYYSRGNDRYEDGTLVVSYGSLRAMKVNCKEGIVREPKNLQSKHGAYSMKKATKNFKGRNFYLTNSGWFMTQSEIDNATIRSLDILGNMRDNQQRRHRALFDYLCVQ